MQPPSPLPLQPSPGVSDLYVFKSRLQEYAQKVRYSTPVYESTKEGPSHMPLFKSTVILNKVRYDSLPGFQNRRLAEQSAAEAALIELSKCGGNKEVIDIPVHETGLCKNLLQEYAQKMNYAAPTYACKPEDKSNKPHFSCTVEIGGICYIGAIAKTKKEAELNAARIALLAIQTSPSQMVEKANEETLYTVLPCKRKELEPASPKQEAVKTRKLKKSRMRRNSYNKKHRVAGDSAIQAGDVVEVQSNVELTTSEGLLGLYPQTSDCQPILTEDTAN